MKCRCTCCTYNEPIKMRKRDGFWWAECPRCGTEYWKTEEKEGGEYEK